MTEDEIRTVAIPHLRGQFERGLPILFTGSGFSAEAKNQYGAGVPLVKEFKKELWKISFPDQEYSDTTTLQELYEYALIHRRAALSNALIQAFTVAADTLPDWYGEVFRLAWFRSYTLNID